MSIKRDMCVTRKGLDACIDVTYGTDLIPIELRVVDFTVPQNAVVVAYAASQDSKPRKIICDISDNIISFEPTPGFFEVGVNIMQIRVTASEKELFSYSFRVMCHDNIASDDAEEVEDNPSLVEQLMSELNETKKEIADEKSQRQSEIDVERKRIDNIIVDKTSGLKEYKITELYLNNVQYNNDGSNYFIKASNPVFAGRSENVGWGTTSKDVRVLNVGVHFSDTKYTADSHYEKVGEDSDYVYSGDTGAIVEYKEVESDEYDHAWYYTCLAGYYANPPGLYANFRVLIAYSVDADNTELEDIRVGADGVKYNSAGEAVRNQFKNIKDQHENDVTQIRGDLDDMLRKDNLFDYNTFTTQTGYPTVYKPNNESMNKKSQLVMTNNPSGNVGHFNEKISLEKGVTYSLFVKSYTTPIQKVYFALYDTNKKILTEQFTNLENVVYYTPQKNEEVIIGNYTEKNTIWENYIFSIYVLKGVKDANIYRFLTDKESDKLFYKVNENISNLFLRKNLFDIRDFIGNSDSPSVKISYRNKNYQELVMHGNTTGSVKIFGNTIRFEKGKVYSCFLKSFNAPVQKVFFGLYKENVNNLVSKQFNSDCNIITFIPNEDMDLHIGFWTAANDAFEDYYFTIYIFEGNTTYGNTTKFALLEDLNDIDEKILKSEQKNNARIPNNINFYQDNIYLQRMLLNDPNLLFYDDFEGNALNQCLWTIRKTGVNMNVVNNELQLYTSENISVKDSMLCLTAKRTIQGDNTQWSSGRIDTQSKFEFGKGTRVEAKIKLPKVRGSWPAFWGLGTKLSEMYSNNLDLIWPVTGETDFLEQVDDNDVIHFNIWSYDGSNPVQNPSSKRISDVSEWHIYAYENDGVNGRFYIDGELCYTVDLSTLSHDNGFNPYKDDYNAQRIVLNLAVGGDMASDPDDTTPDEFSMYIDYVKVTSLEKQLLANEITLLGTPIINIGDKTGYVIAKTTIGSQDKTITFTSNNENIAIVDEYGRISGIASGMCTIYAYANSKIIGTFDITVN